MRTIHRIGIGFLVGLCFAGGYGARLVAMRNEMTAARAEHSVSESGTQVASARLEGAANIDLRPLETMLVILKDLREHYVEQITPQDEGKMTYDSLRAMLSALNDPNTRFLDPAQRKMVTDASNGEFHGIGAILCIRRTTTGNLTEEHLIVISPLGSGPAAQAGLKAGDEIVSIDDKDVLPFNPYQKAEEMVKDDKKNADPSEVRKHLDAEQDRIDNGIPIMEAQDLLADNTAGRLTKVKSADRAHRSWWSTEEDSISKDEKQDNKSAELELTIARKGLAKPFKVKLTRRTFTVTPVASSVLEDDKLGYVKINCLCRTTGEDFEKTLADLRAKHVKGLVLDLRDLAGGTVQSTEDIAKPLLADNRTLAIELRSRGRRSAVSVPFAAREDRWNAPVVVLVNEGTARMPELLAAALRENRGARLVGEKTYGDFSETTMVDQRDGSAMAITTGMFLTSKGGNYNGKGLPVDLEVASTASGDAQLKEAARLLAGRGGKS